ncbi:MULTISPECIES: TrmB family transcriptional regulator [Salinibaculum]|uniref:TrmB family transcriptional regulator n=1 Tax=Salinibaculum TaxID=2732368 RepID=UPI0030D4DC12
MDDDEAIQGLKRLGLTGYEARVFIGLQKLGSGTASDISDVTDVPRSQVYGAAENLEARGLVETQQSRPTLYRPVPLERARTRLLDQLAETGAETFEYLDTVQETESDDERSEAIWLVHGSEAVASRTSELVEAAEVYLLYACSETSMLEEPVRAALAAAADRGVAVVVASANPDVREAVGDDFETVAVPAERDPDVGDARVLIADDETMLLSVYSSADVTDGTEEVAFWSSETAFAAVLGGFLAEWFQVPSPERT